MLGSNLFALRIFGVSYRTELRSAGLGVLTTRTSGATGAATSFGDQMQGKEHQHQIHALIDSEVSRDSLRALSLDTVLLSHNHPCFIATLNVPSSSRSIFVDLSTLIVKAHEDKMKQTVCVSICVCMMFFFCQKRVVRSEDCYEVPPRAARCTRY